MVGTLANRAATGRSATSPKGGPPDVEDSSPPAVAPGAKVRDVTAYDVEVSANKVARGLGWSTGSNLVLRLGNFAVSILMARLIAPEEYGVFAVALTVWLICGSMAEFG